MKIINLHLGFHHDVDLVHFNNMFPAQFKKLHNKYHWLWRVLEILSVRRSMSFGPLDDRPNLKLILLSFGGGNWLFASVILWLQRPLVEQSMHKWEQWFLLPDLVIYVSHGWLLPEVTCVWLRGPNMSKDIHSYVDLNRIDWILVNEIKRNRLAKLFNISYNGARTKSII